MTIRFWRRFLQWRHAFLGRRPHRSFRLTKRRDYVRSLQLPSYPIFTREVASTLWKYRKHFAVLLVFYIILSGLLVGLASQGAYGTLVDTLKKTSNNVLGGAWGQVGKAVLLLASIANGSISPTLNGQQQMYAVILGLLVWLTTVWLLRNLLAGHKVVFRDALYNATTPLVSTFFVFCVFVVQLLPASLAIIAYFAAKNAQIISSGGIPAALFWVCASLLGLLSLFWVTGSFIGLVVVTQPGMYPMKALRIAGDLVVGRRVRILLRILWLILSIVVGWLVIMIPVILLDEWLRSSFSFLQGWPIVPFVVLMMSSLTLLWIAAYVYLLYRKVLDDDALPA